MMIKIYPILTLLILLFAGCESKTGHETPQTEKEDPYVDFKRWSEGRVCDKLLWKCLPESNDTARWQKPLENGLDSFELTPDVMQRRKEIIQRWRDEEDGKVEEQDVKTAALSEEFYDRVEAKRFLVKMEKRLEKEFPGFWRDVPKKVRYRWIQRAMNKAKKFGYKSKRPSPMVELCARIGLDFDKDPKWEAIVKFITSDPRNIGSNMGAACDYIDWTIFGKTESTFGYKITDWAMRDTFGYLPYPKKPYPRLND